MDKSVECESCAFADYAIRQRDAYKAEVETLQKRCKDIEEILNKESELCQKEIAKVALLVQALQFYADKRNWVIKHIRTKSGGIIEKFGERGKTARNALAALKKARET
jgi:hypothetical protein